MTQFPVISLTGPRQSGKSTLVKHTFPDYRYVSFEDPDVYETALDDPRSFLARYDNHVIFDEVQRIPSMFSYLQGIIDERDTVGQYVLSGSQNFLLLKSISQSLAGRVAVLHLLPFSLEELESGNLTPKRSMRRYLPEGTRDSILEASLLPTSFQAISQRMLTEMYGRSSGCAK